MPAEVNDGRLKLIDRLEYVRGSYSPAGLEIDGVLMLGEPDISLDEPDLFIERQRAGGTAPRVSREKQYSDPLGQSLKYLQLQSGLSMQDLVPGKPGVYLAHSKLVGLILPLLSDSLLLGLGFTSFLISEMLLLLLGNLLAKPVLGVELLFLLAGNLAVEFRNLSHSLGMVAAVAVSVPMLCLNCRQALGAPGRGVCVTLFFLGISRLGGRLPLLSL